VNLSDDEIRKIIEEHEGPIPLRKMAREIHVGVPRLRRVISDVGGGLNVRARNDDHITDTLAQKCREAISQGDNLDNDLGALLAIICGVSKKDIVTMAQGGTVSICTGTIPISKLFGRKL
jgi:hypothetical protein